MNTFTNNLKNLDKWIIFLIIALEVISLLMIESTVYDNGLVLSRDIIVQALSYVLGFLSFFIILRMNYTVFMGLEKHLYIVSIVLLLMVYLPGIGYEQFGARAWINLGVTTIQPSEFVKILFVLIMAGYLNERRDDLHNFKGLLKAGIVGGPIIVIVLKEDLGSALVFAAIWLTMVFFAGLDYKVFAKFLALACAAIPVAYLFMADYQKQRIDAFLHPSNLSLPGNYQVWQSKVAIGSGGFFGKGLFQGTQKELDFIPVQKSDFIFSVVGEELGFIGGLIVILLFAFLLTRMVKIAREALDFYGALVVMGFIGMFGFQIFENIAMTMGIMPVTGITLPFLSYGGSSILANMMIMGIILDIGVRSRKITF